MTIQDNISAFNANIFLLLQYKIYIVCLVAFTCLFLTINLIHRYLYFISSIPAKFYWNIFIIANMPQDCNIAIKICCNKNTLIIILKVHKKNFYNIKNTKKEISSS